MEVHIGALTDLEEDAQTIVRRDGIEIGVFRLGDELFAYENKCAHQGGPACEGKIIPKVVAIVGEDRTVRGDDFDETEMHFVCPWHGWEYDMRTGCHAGNPKVRLRPIDVIQRDGEVYLNID
jgi:nitrite reductase/ring-hydroxylating ferredoxin subunit